MVRSFIHVRLLEMLACIILLNQTVISIAASNIADQLQGPTLVHHDGSGEVDLILQSLSKTRTVIVATPEHPPNQFAPQRSRSLVLFGKTPDSVVPSLRGWNLWRARSPVLIILPKEDGNVQEWFESLWNFTRAANVTAMVLSDPVAYLTWYPYRRNACTKVQVVAAKEKSLFPLKIGKNFHGCPIFGASSITIPLVAGVNDGIEPKMIQTVSEKVNLTVSMYFNATVWRPINAFGKPMNDFAYVFENKIDFICSNLPRSERLYWFADDLPSHTQDSISWFVPSPKLVPSTLVIFRAFSSTMWAWFIGIFILSASTFSFILWFETGSPQPVIVRLIASTLSLPTHLTDFRAFRMFGIALYVYSLHTTTAYQSSLMSFLTNPPRQKSITHFEELAATSYRIMIPTSYQLFFSSLTSPHVKVLMSNGRTSWVPRTNTTLVAETGNIAVVGPGITNSYKMQDSVFEDEVGFRKVLMLQKPFLTTPILTYMSPGHPLVPIFSKYTQYLVETGFPKQFLRKWTKVHKFLNPAKEPFSLRNLEGPFALFSFCLIMSSLAFPLEFFYYKWKVRGREFNLSHSIKQRIRRISCSEIVNNLPL